jgi:hypothetical protein
MYGGRKEGTGLDNGLPCNDVLLLSTDVMKWEGAAFKGALNAPTRYGHAVCCIREKVRGGTDGTACTVKHARGLISLCMPSCTTLVPGLLPAA